MRSPYFGLGVHKFPKVPRQNFVTPYLIIKNCMTPSELQCYHKPIIMIMQPLLSVALIICMGVVTEHKLSKKL